MIPNDVELWVGEYIVPAASMMCCYCNHCADPLTWRRRVHDDGADAWCCGVHWYADIANNRETMWKVQGKKTPKDATNIYHFPKVNIV